MSVVLEAKNVTYRYGEGTPFEVAAVEDVSFAIERGELVGVIGHTGSGKSTLIQHFNGLLPPTSGQILLDGEDIWADKAKLRSVRFRVGLCFQYPEYQLFESTVYADIAFGPKNMGLSEGEIDQRVRRAAQFVGLKEEYFEKSPFDLSGGEKRRAAIAGVMAMEPEVLILDEPTAGLDPRGRDLILELVKAYQQETESTVLLVSHSMEDVAKLATKGARDEPVASCDVWHSAGGLFTRGGACPNGAQCPAGDPYLHGAEKAWFPCERQRLYRQAGERGAPASGG